MTALSLQASSGDKISIKDPVLGKVIIFGETVSIDATNKDAIIFANILSVNAPKEGVLFATGGQLTVNSNISGIIIAAGNMIDLSEKSTNAILTANKIYFDPEAIMIRDAYVAGGSISNNGNISGKPMALTDNFQNKNMVEDLQIHSPESVMLGMKGWLRLFGIFGVVGFGFLGVMLVKLLPNHFGSVRLVIKRSLIKNKVLGFY